MLLLASCGKAPEPTTPPTAGAEQEPSGTPTSGKPSLVVQPPAKSAASPAGKVVYVIEGFEAMNADGTHEIPTGAEVQVVSEEGDEYVISYGDLSVRTPKAYFSETRIEEIAEPTPAPVAEAPTPTPDTIPLSSDQPFTEPLAIPAPEPIAAATPEPVEPTEPVPAATPVPESSTLTVQTADDLKAQALMSQIVTINEEIRSATDKMEAAPASEKAKEAAKIEKLKKRRDALGASLTEVAKP
jgi:hypothetical protein